MEKTLRDGLNALGLTLPETAVRQLLDYVQLIGKWNRVFNLTAVRDPTEMVTRHVLDSLAVLPFVKGPRVLDIGSGAGLPGVPLAVARPELSVVLLDANAKKTRFLTQAVGALRLGNVEAVQARIERYHPAAKFDTLISRAFAGIADMLASSRHLCAPGGQFLAMKGTYPQEELAQLPAEFEVRAVETLRVPGLSAARHLVIIVPRAV